MDSSAGVVPFSNTIHSAPVDFSQPIDASSLKDRTILITGGSSGLGAAFFTLWASHGATVIIGDINASAGQSLVEKTRSSTKNPNLHFLKLDVTDWASQVSFFREAAKLSPHGGIDCVVANAGINGSPESLALTNPPDFTSLGEEDPLPPPPKLRTVEINLVGVMYTTSLAHSYLPRNPGSVKCSIEGTEGPRDRHLILVASIAGLMGLPGQSIYTSTKHAVTGLFRALRFTSPIVHGVRVNLLCPYFVDTPILGVLGNAILAGGGMATIDGVVDAGTRLVADTRIIGRGFGIGPKVNAGEARAAGFETVGDGEERAVWDVHAGDFEQSDVFSRRIIGLTNLKADQRGWSGLLGDLGWAFTSPIRRFFR